MSLYPIFGVRTLLLLVLPVFLAAVILAEVGQRGTSVFKKQGVAWGITLLMVIAAIGIGYAKAPFNNPKPENVPAPTQTIPPAAATAAPPASADSFVWDNVNALSSQTERELNQRNDRLLDRYGVVIGVVTCNNYGGDLYSYTMQCAEDMGLASCDFIVALDITGDNYWLIQGADLVDSFSDETCADYAYDYMEDWFARGDYDSAVLNLTEALEAWYGVYYY